MTAKKQKIVVFSGAGVSAESGIATFRDSNGLWENYDVHEVAHVDSWDRNKALMLRFYNERRRQLQQCEPNTAHRMIAEMEKYFEVTVVTQNVDNLHERGGSTSVIHLHGELTKACNSNKTEVIEIGYRDILLGQKASDGSQLRPFIVWFGESVPRMYEAQEVVEKADILIVVGTSLQVYPASMLIDYASSDADIFVVDPQPLPLKAGITQIREKAGTGMLKIFEILTK